MMENYIIIDRKDRARFYRAPNAKVAAIRYAAARLPKCQAPAFLNVVKGLDLDMVIHIFNGVCAPAGQGIQMVLSDYTTVYREGK